MGFSLHDVKTMIDNSEYSFKFQIYKISQTVARHTGVLVYLDSVPRFFRWTLAMNLLSLIPPVHPKVYIWRPDSVITFNTPKQGSNI